MAQMNIRHLAVEALLQIREGAFSHEVMDQALRKHAYLSKADRSFFSRLVHGVLEYRLQLDYVIGLYSKTPLKKLRPLIITVLETGVYQILYMERVPGFALVNESVKLVKKRGLGGLSGFVNALLRRVMAERERIVFPGLSEKYSCPEWMLKTIQRDIPEAYLESTLAFFLEPQPLWLRINTAKTTREAVIHILQEQGFAWGSHGLHRDFIWVRGFDQIQELSRLLEGRCYIQGPGTGMGGFLAAPQKGGVVLDVCGAPGGKSIHLANQMDGEGEILCFDISPAKTALIQENIRQSGFQNIQALLGDARIFNPALKHRGDLVVADLPCSGLGILGKKPDIKYRLKEEDIASLAKLQSEILDNVCRYVKPGGRLLFSTCTLSALENEDNARQFLQRHPEFAWGEPGETLSPEERENIRDIFQGEGMVKIVPGRDKADGFFIALFRRRND